MKKEFDRNDDLEKLWNEHKEAIEAAAYNYKVRTGISEEIEDLVQDGFFGLLKAIETYDPVTYPDVPLGAWVIIKCKGEWSKYVRDRDPARTALSLDAPSTYGSNSTIGDYVADTISDDAEGVEDRVIRDLMMTGYMDIITQLMGDLEPETAALLRAYYLENVPLSQLHAENASAKIRTGLRQLRRALIARGINVEGGLHYESN